MTWDDVVTGRSQGARGTRRQPPTGWWEIGPPGYGRPERPAQMSWWRCHPVHHRHAVSAYTAQGVLRTRARR